MSSDALVPVLIALIGSGGLVGGIVAFMKLRPEKDAMVVSAANVALTMQTGIVQTLREELERATARLEECEAELSQGRSRRRELHRQLGDALGRAALLERELAQLRGQEHRPPGA